VASISAKCFAAASSSSPPDRVGGESSCGCHSERQGLRCVLM
jgi:hypothetical protein